LLGRKLREDTALFNPSDYIRYTAKNMGVSVNSLRVPERLLITYQRSAYKFVKELIKGKSIEWIYKESQPFCIGKISDIKIGVCRLWIGAPAAMTLEEAIACGAKIILEFGLSGGLQMFLRPGDIVVVTEAIRDEGTSYHYFSEKVQMESSQRLRNKIVDCLKRDEVKYYLGPVWTTDGVYRETLGKFSSFKNTGVLAVDMETSAIFAVAKYRNVEAASVQIISDILTEKGWLQAFHDQSVREAQKLALKEALKALSES
jgi:uridine phosphorylase